MRVLLCHATGPDDAVPSEFPPAVIGQCSKWIEGCVCGKDVVYPPPHFCYDCIKRKVAVRRQTPDDVSVSVDIWRNKVGNEVRRKLEKSKPACANMTFKVAPTPVEVFRALHNRLCELQPKNGGRHLSVLKQHAGQRGGDLQHYSFDVISGDLVAAFFKSTFVFGMQQGSVNVRDDGTVLAIIAPMTFTLKQKLPLHLNEPVMTVVVDSAALPVDGVFRFDDQSVDYSANSKEHMKLYICRQLRTLLRSFESMELDDPTRRVSRNILTPRQLVQVDFIAPQRAQQAQGASSSQATAAPEPAP
eukprot:2110020-Pleurochrysis_carterae.AAC.3